METTNAATSFKVPDLAFAMQFTPHHPRATAGLHQDGFFCIPRAADPSALPYLTLPYLTLPYAGLVAAGQKRQRPTLSDISPTDLFFFWGLKWTIKH